ncbi:hypothetical protein RNJ44_00792 [Nakaseomyces bracarensis]|uniref:Uncharacterized protein n=1 Tax=Nakaseomyces bracarensis TaxID=273131 RepID=A0ABR4NS28_9SACH
MKTINSEFSTSSESILQSDSDIALESLGAREHDDIHRYYVQYLYPMRAYVKQTVVYTMKMLNANKKLRRKLYAAMICSLIIFYGAFLVFESDDLSVTIGFKNSKIENSSIEENLSGTSATYDEYGNLSPEALNSWNSLQKELQTTRPLANDRSYMNSYDTTELIEKQNYELMATNNFVKDREFKSFSIKSYQSNANIEGCFSKQKQCDAITLESNLEFSPKINYINEDIYELVQRLMKEDPWLKEHFEEIAKDKNVDLKQLAKNYLYRFGSSSQWIEDYQCYLVYSRLVIAPTKVRNLGFFSLIVSQAFDKNWNEIKGKKIPYLDITTPDNLAEQIAAIENQIPSIVNCSELPDKSLISKCNEDLKIQMEQIEEDKHNLLSKYYRIYPSLIKVPFKLFKNSGLSGPEDPKISLRKNKDGRTEPIVLFNRAHELYGRIMHAVLPHRRYMSTIPLYLASENMAGSQKNWSPIYSEDDGASDFSRGSITLVATVSPLIILNCSLDTGLCEKTFDVKDKADKSAKFYSSIRGGTSYVKLPPVVPDLRGRDIWVGLVKPHLDSCGASSRFYRMALTLLEKSNGNFHYSLITETLDFDRPVRSWSLKDNYSADGYNVRSPNSIISWDVVGQNNETHEYEDYMQISVSEADVESYVFVLKGVMNYITKSFQKPNLYEYIDWSNKASIDKRVNLGHDCYLTDARAYCYKYGAKYPKV